MQLLSLHKVPKQTLTAVLYRVTIGRSFRVYVHRINIVVVAATAAAAASTGVMIYKAKLLGWWLRQT